MAFSHNDNAGLVHFNGQRYWYLARFETIKYYRLLSQPFSEESGELTPSLKVKRKVVMEKYRDLIDSMYPDEYT
jgi:long-subunit acyl-CoA synthetase (AMP-forming)